MFLVIICGFSPRKGGYLGWSGGLLESITPEQRDYERRQESEGLINTNMRKPLGQPNVPTARRGSKTIKIGGNLFVSLEEGKKKKVSHKTSLFRCGKAIFLFSCSEKEYALLASVTRAVIWLRSEAENSRHLKLLHPSILLSDYNCRAFSGPQQHS